VEEIKIQKLILNEKEEKLLKIKDKSSNKQMERDDEVHGLRLSI